MELQEFQKQRDNKIKEIEQILTDSLPKEVTEQKTIFSAMEYALMGGGKRLRPMLVREAYLAMNGKSEEVIYPFMAAMEMIHTYSLIHDDLPAMDNDDFRRGRKTTHLVYGEDMGILAGDALLNFAFETALRTTDTKDARLESACISRADWLERVTWALRVMANKAGVYGMVGGQVVDVEETGKDLSQETLLFIHHKKTAALLEASLMIGAILAGASETEVSVMEQAGEGLGMAFQIQDDILDVTSTTQELGKPVHSDEKNGKNTYIELFGMEKACHSVEEYSAQALTKINELPGDHEFLLALISSLIHRKN